MVYSDSPGHGRSRIAAVMIRYLPSSLIGPSVRDLLPELTPLSPEEKRLFDDSYEVYGSFNFTPKYARERQVTTLGSTALDKVPGLPDVGSVKVIHVLVEGMLPGVAAIHQHVLVASTFSLARGGEDGIADLVRFLHNLFWLRSSAGWIEELDPLGANSDRENGTYSKRGIYTNILLSPADASLLSEWQRVAGALYSFLHLHANGWSEEVALERLRTARYGSTDFFTGFIRNDSAVTISTPYPPGSFDEGTCFDVLGREQASIAFDGWKNRLDTLGDKYEHYDLIPQFPSLHFSALALLEYAGNAEYARWQIHEELAWILERPWILRLINSISVSNRVDRLYFRLHSPDMLRLNGMRRTGNRLVTDEMNQNTERSIEGMRASLTNSLLALLAILAALLAALQIILGLA